MGDPGTFLAHISQTTCSSSSPNAYLVMVTLTQKRFCTQYGWFCHGWSHIILRVQGVAISTIIGVDVSVGMVKGTVCHDISVFLVTEAGWGPLIFNRVCGQCSFVT